MVLATLAGLFQDAIKPIFITEGNNQDIIDTTVVIENGKKEETSRENKITLENKYSSFIDKRDGKSYKTVKIGKQIWMAENLKFKTKKSFSLIDGNTFYNWSEANWVCPKGWHLPSKSEWKELALFLGGWSIAGKELKNGDSWKIGRIASNSSGFSADPIGGYKLENQLHSIGLFCNWWTSSKTKYDTFWGISLSSKYDILFSGAWTSDSEGDKLPCRCIKDKI